MYSSNSLMFVMKLILYYKLTNLSLLRSLCTHVFVFLILPVAFQCTARTLYRVHNSVYSCVYARKHSVKPVLRHACLWCYSTIHLLYFTNLHKFSQNFIDHTIIILRFVFLQIIFTFNPPPPLSPHHPTPSPHPSPPHPTLSSLLSDCESFPHMLAACVVIFHPVSSESCGLPALPVSSAGIFCYQKQKQILHTPFPPFPSTP
jgi:hypothetical protein